MSAWTFALMLGSGYLMHKNLQGRGVVAENAQEFHERAKPAEPLATETIRSVQRAVPDADKFEDMNLQDLSREEAQKLASFREAAHQQVAAYEKGPPPIQGVYLVRGL